MDEQRSGRFRVYRVVESVPHINLFETDDDRLYTVFQSGYGERQAAVDDLRTGDLVAATLTGDPGAETEPWSLAAVDRIGGVDMDFAVDVDPPAVATDLWTEDLDGPARAVLEEGEQPVAEVYVQPRAPLPGGAFVPNVVAGLVPMEPWLTDLPVVGAPASEAVFLDPDPPTTDRYSHPYGVVVLFGPDAGAVRDGFRERYGVPTGDPAADTRPAFDPYGL